VAAAERAADLLGVAARYSSFPIVMETYRECLRDVFDLASAADILRRAERGDIRVTTVDSEKPSPYASALLFSYIANYIYDGDAPLAERRAQALSIDQSQLEEILGSTDFRELLDKAALDEVEAQLQSLDPDYHARHADGLHDLLLKLGDLSPAEIEKRSASPAVAASIDELIAARRVLRVRIAGEVRYIPVEYAAAYRDALGVPLPPGLAEVFLRPAPDAAGELVRRYVRTHGPFTTAEAAARFGLDAARIEPILRHLHAAGKLLEGEFRPEGMHREWCDPAVLQQVRRKTLARLRREVVPAEHDTFARFLGRWQGASVARRGSEALIDAIEILQGAELLASDLEREILPARVANYQPADLDALLASGEVVWVGREQIGDRDGRVSVYLTQSLERLLPPPAATETRTFSERAGRILEFLGGRGASFFSELHQAAGGGFPGETVAALWELAWAGKITNDTFFPVRNFLNPNPKEQRSPADARGYLPGSPEFLRRLRGRSPQHAGAQGRWALTVGRIMQAPNPTEWSAAVAQQLLVRNGIVTRETAIVENIPGGYPTIYPALRTMEESGWIRRGMFVAGLGAAQFAMPAAVDLLRSLRTNPERPEAIYLSASDPANPYGGLLPWSRTQAEADATDGAKIHSMARAAGAAVVLVNGRLAAYFRRRNPAIRVFLPEDEPDRSHVARELAKKLAEVAIRRQGKRTGLLIGEIDGFPARQHFLARFLEDAGFVETAAGFQMRRVLPTLAAAEVDPEPEEEDVPETA
jgi:ATP-dependent Lhr-like helicase